MVTLEQVKLLEAKVAKAIGYVEKVSSENAELRGKLGSYQKRIDELEVLVQQFKEDQGRIEDGILSALDRLNQFEDAIERSLDTKGKDKKPAKAETKPAEPKPAVVPPKPVAPPPAPKPQAESPAAIIAAEAELPDNDPPDLDLEGGTDSGEELDLF
jgi:septal ring factor EnvC (AmiA/AmiB activator)